MTMKKLSAAIIGMLSLAATATAQNIQLHYDFGRNIYSDEEAARPKVTATFEQFKADRFGSWYYFIDMDLSSKGVESAYGELSREFTLGEGSPFAVHVEYDGGLTKGSVFQPAALAGMAYNGHNADFSTTYSLQLMYKQYYKGYNNSAYASVQLTGVWSTTFADRKLTFAGFFDIWRGEKANGHGQLVFLTEPQLWYNFSPHFSAGTEIEISDSFIFNLYNDKTFFINPTLAVKYTF